MSDKNILEKFRLPTYSTAKGDLSKRWTVEYYVWQRSLNNGQGGLVRRQIHCPAKYKTASSRKRWGKDVVARISKLLNDGFFYVSEPAQQETLDDLAVQTVIPELPLTLLKALDIVVRVRESTAYRQRTGESYRNAYRRLEDYLKQVSQSELLLADTSAKHLYGFSDYIVQTQGLSSRYRNNLIDSLNTLFKDLIKREYLQKNPAENVDALPLQTSRRNLAFVADQRATLETYLQENDPQLYAFTRFVYQAFMRPIELTRLQVRDIDIVNKRIVCHSSVTKGGSRKQITEYVEITASLATVIDGMHLDRYEGADYLFGHELKPGRTPIVRNRVSERHREALEGAGLYNGELSLYSWKHTGVVNAWKAGASIEWLQRHLRHADLKDTVIYLKSLGLMLSEKSTAPSW